MSSEPVIANEHRSSESFTEEPRVTLPSSAYPDASPLGAPAAVQPAATASLSATKLTTLSRTLAMVIPVTRWRPQRPSGRLVQEVGWLAAGQAASVVASLVGIRLVTELVNPSVYGEAAIALTISALASQTLLAPLGSTAARYFVIATEERSTAAFFRAMKRLLTFASLTATGGGGVLSIAVAVAFGERWLLTSMAAIALAIVSGWANVLDAFQNAARQRAVVAWHQALGQVMRPLAVIGLVTLLGVSPAAVVGGQFVAAGAVLASQLLFFAARFGRQAKLPQAASRQFEREMRAYAIPFGTWSVFTWLQSSADRWALQVFASSHDVGIYAVVFGLSMFPMTLAGRIIVQVAAPILFQRAGPGITPGRVRQAFVLTVALATLMGVATVAGSTMAVLLHKYVFQILVAAPFRAESSLLPLGIAAAGLYNVAQILSLIPQHVQDSRSLIAPMVGSALIGTCLAFAGGWLAGVQGVFVSEVGFAIVYLIWVSLVCVKIVHRYGIQITATSAGCVRPVLGK
jgi:O-antigen/teichoic acid export membrane protein